MIWRARATCSGHHSGSRTRRPVSDRSPSPGVPSLAASTSYAVIQSLARLAHAALKDCPSTQLTADLGDAFVALLVLHDRGARDHRQFVRPPQLGDQLLGHAVQKILVLGIGADVRKRQHLVQRRLPEGRRALQKSSPEPRLAAVPASRARPSAPRAKRYRANEEQNRRGSGRPEPPGALGSASAGLSGAPGRPEEP